MITVNRVNRGNGVSGGRCLRSPTVSEKDVLSFSTLGADFGFGKRFSCVRQSSFYPADACCPASCENENVCDVLPVSLGVTGELSYLSRTWYLVSQPNREVPYKQQVSHPGVGVKCTV